MIAALAALGGCAAPNDGAGQTARVVPPARDGGSVFLTVDFEADRTLRYKFTSRRTVSLDWDPNGVMTQSRVQEHAEHMEMIVAYTPVEVDPYGVSTIRATVEAVRAIRRGGPTGRTWGTDAVAGAQGRSFAIQVDPRGRIVEASQLKALIREMGEQAFQADSPRGRIKNQDMVGDFVASQWFLWDAVATVPLPAEGLVIGQTWSSQLSVPTPMVLRKARDVTYRFNGFRAGENASLAVIESTYTLADSAPSDWPVPYAGRFQMSGTFGLLGSYEVLGLKGSGEELFNIRAGRIEQQRQRYTMYVRAELPPMGIRANPHMEIEQTLTMELLSTEE